MIEIGEILRRLPHRYPFLLIDRAVDYVPNKSIRGIKNVTINEPFFPGHFPGAPVMPGVLQIEALAQTGALLDVENAGSRHHQAPDPVHVGGERPLQDARSCRAT